jgi:chemotaxis protein CheC
MIEFSDFERDALSEVFNIGVGHAAATLSIMVGEQIQLAVPNVQLVARSEAFNTLSPSEGGQICAVRQHFRGEMAADALLIFSERNGLELVRAMLRQMGEQSFPLDVLGEMAQEAVSEIGNIVLNSVMSTIADLFGTSFTGSLPVVQIGSCDDIFKPKPDEAAQYILVLHISFGIESFEVRGYLAFILDVPAIDNLKKNITRVFSGLN